MTDVEIPLKLDLEHHRSLVGPEPQIFHCHHYNNYLQRTILEDAPYLDSRPILRGAAAEVAHHQLSQLFGNKDLEERKQFAQSLFAWAGFGRVDLSGLTPEGGTVESPGTHYSLTWKTKYGQAAKPVDLFATGWLAGAAAALFDLPLGSFSAKQTECLSSQGGEVCRFELSRGEPNYPVYTPAGVGSLSKHELIEVEANHIDSEGILKALSAMPIEGGPDGIIKAFGVYLTRHYANFYNRISFEFLNELERGFGLEGRHAGEPLLIEAGHQCGFFTFGGIMLSPEWEGLIQPQVQEKKDLVHGLIATINAFGWGRYQVTDVSDQGARFVLHDDYESVGYEAMYGKAAENIVYLAQGGLAAALELVYLADIEDRPVLNAELYAKLFKGKEVFQTQVVSCRARGDRVTEIEVSR